MREEYKEILRYWLKIDLMHIANQSGFISEKVEISDLYIKNTVHILDKMTRDSDIDKNLVITVIALMWEHINKEKYDIREFVLLFLSRIGYPTSAIICDSDFDKDNCLFSPVKSIVHGLSIMAHQEKNEIQVRDNKFLLTDYQKEIWDAIEGGKKLVGISAPTSAGKSFVIALKLMSELCKHNMDIVYIVPTLSLINQVTEDFNYLKKILSVDNCFISNSFDGNNSERNYVYVLTQEKAIAALSIDKDAFCKKLVLVVDEIQNIERIQDADDERAKVLFDSLIEFRYKENVYKIILAGPRIENIDILASDLFENEAANCSTDISPVLNLTYSIAKYGNNYYLKQYCALVNRADVCLIQNDSNIKGYGKKQYDDPYLGYLKNLVNKIGGNSQNLIFAPTVSTARKLALCLEGRKTEQVQSLEEYYKKTVRENYALCRALENGVAYNHGRLPMHVRRTIEKAICNKMVSNVVCTTTLLQGVNLPAQNIFIRNPHLYVKKQGQEPELTNYEMANLRGRAGRLLKDFIGRTFVLDENSFGETEGYEQEELFDNPEKELPIGFEEQFDSYSNEIIEAISKEKTVSDDMRGYGHLVTYIRQTVLRYKKDAKEKLDDVGIHLTKKQVAAIILKMDELSVPIEICLKNRYWDPMILDYVYNNVDCDVPNTARDKDAKKKLANILKWLRDSSKTECMYYKYISNEYSSGQKRHMMCEKAIKWAKEEKLSDLLRDNYYDGEKGMDHIDDTINMLEQIVSYKLPMLLKPIYDMKLPESTFLSSLQTGAIKPITRRMIEIGIPRETAIFIDEQLFSDMNDKNEVDEFFIRKMIKDNYNSLPYWIQVQISYLT